MHKVAMTASAALVVFKLAASGLPEISHWREFRNNSSSAVETARKCLDSSLGSRFSVVFAVHVAKQMVADIITDVQLFDFTVLAQLQNNNTKTQKRQQQRGPPVMKPDLPYYR